MDPQSLEQRAHDLFDAFDSPEQDQDQDPISQSVGEIVSSNAKRSRDLAGNEATANALIENLGSLHSIIEEQAGEELSAVMIDHVTSLLNERSLRGDKQIKVTLPKPEVIHPTARLLGGDSLENALILNGQAEENEALVAFTAAALTAISDSLSGTPDTDDIIARIVDSSLLLDDGPRAVTVH